MLTFFRRGITEKIMLVVLVIGLFAIVITGFGTGGSGIGDLGTGAETLVKVGDERVTSADVQTQVDRQIAQARQQQPEISTAQFLANGVYEEIIRQLIQHKALLSFGEDQGLAVSKRLVDGEIANIPAFRNLAGQFDDATFRAALAQQQMTEQQLRDDIAGSLIQQQMYLPIVSGGPVPNEMAKQYASLLLEQRTGVIGLVPASAMGLGREPTDQEVAAYFKQNVQRYTIPERRTIRYAAFGRDSLGAAGQATEAEIAAFYKNNPQVYGASETRTLSQVVFPTQQAAQAFAARLAQGASFADAARQSGFGNADTSIGQQTREALANVASPAVAQAAYSAEAGAATAPVQSPLGWHVIRVDEINRTPARSLESVADEIRTQIEVQKGQQALLDKVGRIEEQLADGASFEEVARAERLTIAETPPLTAAGAQPGVPDAAPIAEAQPLLKPAFEMEPDDDPEVATLTPNERFAVFAVGRVVPAAPPPFAQIAAQVKADLVSQRALDRARAVATALVAKINGRVAPAQAFAEAQPRLQAPEQVTMRRVDIAQGGQQVPPPLALLFSLPVGRAQLIPAPQGQGWFVVTHLSSQPGDATSTPQLIAATRSQFQSVSGEEYAEQFVRAVQQSQDVRRNEDAINATRAQLTGTSAQ